jgi:hypothetical protein
MKKTPDTRLSFDSRGLPRWERRTTLGDYRPVSSESAEMRRLNVQELSLAEKSPHLEQAGKSYGPTSQRSVRSRNGLDYLRLLSRSIEARRAQKS